LIFVSFETFKLKALTAGDSSFLQNDYVIG